MSESASERRTRTLERDLCWVALFVASVDALVVPVARFTDLLSGGFLRGLIIGSAGLLAVLFIRILLDPVCHRAISEAVSDMRGNGSVKRRWLSPLDRTWGLFGSRSGGGYLAAERVVLLVEFLLCLAASGNTGGPPSKPLLLSFAGFAITMMLTLIQLKVQFPSTDEEVAPR